MRIRPPAARNPKHWFPLPAFALALLGAGCWSAAVTPPPKQASPVSDPLFSEFVLDGDTGEWNSRQSLELIPSDPGGRTGRIWVAQVENGLAFAGEVTGPPPRWSKGAAELGDHIEVRLADEEAAVLPPIGWGNQFGFAYLESEKDCDRKDPASESSKLERDCKAWLRRQVDYRRDFRRLFERTWRITPKTAVETAASVAFESLLKDGAGVSALEPAEVAPEVEIQDADLAGLAYRFELLLPWGAFPPMRPLRLDAVRFRIDVHGFGGEAGRGRSSTAGASDDAALDRFALSSPLEYHLTPCRYELSNLEIDTGAGRGRLRLSENAKIYFQPQLELDLRRLIVIENEIKGYQYEPDPKSRSPIAYQAPFFSRDLGGGREICWPVLTLLDGDRVSTAGEVILPGDEVELKTLSESRALVKVGPKVFYSYYGSGQCGGCPRVSLQVFSLNLDSVAVIEAFEFHEVVLADIDIEVSKDWGTVTVFTAGTDSAAEAGGGEAWTATRHCLDATVGLYRPCGRQSPVPEPHPRRIKPYGQD